MRRNVYAVNYRMHQFGEQRRTYVAAANKAEAYEVAFYEAIPAKEDELPYSAWVANVTYQNGNIRVFNTSEGKAF